MALRLCLDIHAATEQRVGKKNVIAMYTCKDNLIPLLYSGKIKKIYKKKEIYIRSYKSGLQ